MFDSQKIWAESLDAKVIFDGYAKDLGLDLKKFDADMSDASTQDRINRDLKEAGSLQLQGTPTFILNGKKLELGQISTYELFKGVIDKAITDANAK